MLQLLENGLFALGQVLRFPIVVLLWVCVAAALFMVGRCFMEFVGAHARAPWLRPRPRGCGRDRRSARTSARLAALPVVAAHARCADVETMRAASALGDGGLEHLVLEREERARHGLTPSRALVKVGPSLGLHRHADPDGLVAGGDGHRQPGGAWRARWSSRSRRRSSAWSPARSRMSSTAVRQHWVAESVREQRFLAERIAAELAEHAAALGTAPALAGVGR